MKLIPAAAVAAFFPFVFAGCLATSREIVELRDDINQLRLKLNELQINQADLGDKMSSLDLNISAFSERLEENKNVMSLVARRLDDMESNITSKVGKISDKLDAPGRGQSSSSVPSGESDGLPPRPPSPQPSEIPPGELYRMAYDDFVAGRQESAAETFRIFLAEHPDASLAPSARYYLGESYYSRSMWKDASAEFSALAEKYPKSEHTLSALYKKALAEEKLGNSEEAKKIYADIIKTHPASQEAVSAAERLGDLSGPSQKK